jgi:hypothetical protein
MDKVYLTYSAKADALSLLKHGAGGDQPIQNHVIVCDGKTGVIYRATDIGVDPSAYKWPDTKILGTAELSKLVYFESRLGPELINNVCRSLATLTVEEHERVLEAHARYKIDKVRVTPSSNPVNNLG